MLTRKRGNMLTVREKRRHSGFIHFVASQLAVIGWLATSTLPSTAQTSKEYYAYPYSYLSASDFRVCASRLLSVKLPPPAAAAACSQALDPRSLSKCVVDINKNTRDSAISALDTCRQARRPTEVSNCVVGISRSSYRQADPADLAYCGRTLLPGRFADCVVGLRRSLNFSTPALALDTCISATDQIYDLSPNFVPQNGTPSIPSPILTPLPSGNFSPNGDVSPITPSLSSPAGSQ